MVLPEPVVGALSVWLWSVGVVIGASAETGAVFLVTAGAVFTSAIGLAPFVGYPGIDSDAFAV